jgi:hypothetical protein
MAMVKRHDSVDDVFLLLNASYDMQRTAGDLLRAYANCKGDLPELYAMMSYGTMFQRPLDVAMRAQVPRIREAIARLQKYVDQIEADWPEK